MITSQVARTLTLHLPGRDFCSVLEGVKGCSGRSYGNEGVGLKGNCGISWVGLSEMSGECGLLTTT